MTAEVFATVLAGLTTFGGLLSAIVKYREISTGLQRRIEAFQRILGALEDQSASRDALAAEVDRLIGELIEHNRDKRRNWANVGLGIFLLAPAAGAVWVGTVLGGLWWLLTLPLGFFGLVGVFALVDGLRKGKRNDRGQLVRRTTRSGASATPSE